MTQYASCLERALHACLAEGETIQGFFPGFAAREPRLARHISQYVVYQACAPIFQSDINHVIDHSYSHLLHTMDGSRTVVTLHDMIWAKVRNGEYQESPKRLSAVQRHNLSGLAKAARIVCDSEASQKALLRFLPRVEARTCVIPPGLNDTFAQPAKVSLGEKLFSIPKPFIFHPGHTQSYKNIPALFYTLAEIYKSGQDIRLVKTGTPFTLEQEELAERLGIKNLVHHLGKVPSECLQEIYRTADVLLLPSHDEGFGFPALEAMKCGLPVVASNRGSLPELIRDAGILTEPDDYAAMAKSILTLLSAPSIRSEFIARGKKRAEVYAWQNTAKELLKVYRNLYMRKSV